MKSIRESNLVSENEIAKLFCTVEVLLPLHRDLVDQLSKSPCVASLLGKKGESDYTVGKSFMMMVNNLLFLFFFPLKIIYFYIRVNILKCIINIVVIKIFLNIHLKIFVKIVLLKNYILYVSFFFF